MFASSRRTLVDSELPAAILVSVFDHDFETRHGGAPVLRSTRRLPAP